MRQRVDPFIPIKKGHHDLRGQYGAQYLKKPEVVVPVATGIPIRNASSFSSGNNIDNQRRRSIDGVARLPRLQRDEYNPRVIDEAKTTRPPSSVEAKSTLVSKPAKTRIRRFPHKLRFILFITLAVCVGLSLQYLDAGEFIITAYGIFVLIKHVSSRTTFILAMIALICIVLLSIFQGANSGMSENFAVYTFLLVVVGTISLGLETRRHPA